MPVVRTRIAVALVSLAVILLELALMRALALRFWHHFAHMVVGVALLGFGASGTFLTLARRRMFGGPEPIGRARTWIVALTAAFALSVPATLALARAVPIDVQFLAWDLSGIVHVLALELVMFVPFVLAAAAIGIVLMDRPERLSGHYAANLVGSGLGAVASVLLMHVMSARGCLIAVAAIGYAAGAVLVPRRRASLAALAAVAVVLVPALWLAPLDLGVSQYKMLSHVRNVAEHDRDTRVIVTSEGPLGRIDVAEGPALHRATGLSLQYTGPVPPHVLIIVDGDQTSPVYDCAARGDWTFMDHTVPAAAYHLRERPKTLVIGAGGGSDIGLARFHECREVVALEMNPDVIDLMTGPLADRGGSIYEAPGVTVLNQEARGYLASAGGKFDVIQLPALDAFGASGAGLYAAQESYLYTVESFARALDRLAEDGILCVSRWARTPPRDGLRIFDTAAEALRARGLDPSRHLVMIRNWATVAVLVFKRPVTRHEVEALRRFCERRSFDVCYFPGIERSDANRYHDLGGPYYFDAARALLGPGRAEFLERYLFDVEAATDDKPYFFHFFRASSMRSLKEQLGGRSRAFLELGLVMLVAALIQVGLMSAVLLVVPLAPGIRRVRLDGTAAASLGYFLLLGAGFMLLEMGFLQRLIVYLAHPIYSAAAVISSFLVFGGLGSHFSRAWPFRPDRTAALAAGAVVGLTLVCAVALGPWLSLTQAMPVVVRFIVASVTMAPLAFAMGHMFPTGLALVGRSRPELVPWAWAVNGFASVVATLAAPLIAMSFGFSRLVLIAAACYAAAGALSVKLPRTDPE